jgi:hypothetical protein
MSPAALAAVSAILSAPPEPLPGDRKPARVTTSAASPAFVPPPPAPAAVAPAASTAPPSVRLAAAAPPARPAAPPSPTQAPAPAAPPKPKSGAALRSLDQVIVDYLASEAASEHLEITLTADGDLISGETVALTVKASTSLTEKPLAGAHVSIRVVSTVRPPQILFRGVTGADGVVKSACALPDIGTGNAALIIAASSGLGNNEIKQLIRKKPR